MAELLPGCDVSSANVLSSANLEAIFHRLASLRQGPTSKIVELAREQGRVRVVTDTSSQAAWKKRNDNIRAKWADVETVKAFFDAMHNGPFDGKGGYAHALTTRASKPEREI